MQSKTHVAIIMDGNRRWARARGLPDAAGHQAGVTVLRRIVEVAPDFGIATLTVYAFSSDNWRRPESEVDALMALQGPVGPITGEIHGGWEFVIAAYLVSAVILIGYSVSVHLRYVQERARRVREEGGA